MFLHQQNRVKPSSLQQDGGVDVGKVYLRRHRCWSTWSVEKNKNTEVIFNQSEEDHLRGEELWDHDASVVLVFNFIG